MTPERINFSSRLKSAWMTPQHASFRPPSWPPPRDWVVSESTDGMVVSRWGDAIWDLSSIAGSTCPLNFGDGEALHGLPPIDSANADLLRTLTTWRIWGPRSLISPHTLKNSFFLQIRKIVALCSQHGILARDLHKHPRIIDKIPSIFRSSMHRPTITSLHLLWDAREDIGFFLIDSDGIRRLSAGFDIHQTEQTAYIPPRIWSYQLQRLNESIDDFLAHKQQIEDCYNFCLDAYSHNYGSLEAALATKIGVNQPFGIHRSNAGKRSGKRYEGPFEKTAEKFGIRELLFRWVAQENDSLDIRLLSAYLSQVQYASLAFITNFTLQRISESTSLRTNCLTWEDDEKLGRIPIIHGETTKTQIDSDARWPTSPTVTKAITAASAIAHLRMRCNIAHPKSQPNVDHINFPYLIDKVSEPWIATVSERSYALRIRPDAYSRFIERFPKFFAPEKIRITEEDLRLARMLTPSIIRNEKFAVGESWPFSWHQVRRTGAVNMFASGLLSDSTMQFLMKHSSRLMPLYYGRGYTKLHLNEDTQQLVVSAMYEAIALKLEAAFGSRFASPYGEERKQAILVNIVNKKDSKFLVEAARKGRTSFREIRLGACTKRGICEYGGIESVARCAGGDGGAPCADALFDREKSKQVKADLAELTRQLDAAPANSPLRKALNAEVHAMENFLDLLDR